MAKERRRGDEAMSDSRRGRLGPMVAPGCGGARAGGPHLGGMVAGELSHLHCLAGELRHIHSVGELRHLHSVEVITTQFRHSLVGSVVILHPSATSCQSQQSSTEPNPATDLTGGSPPPPGLLPAPLPPPGEGLAEGLPQLQQGTSGAEENDQ